MRRMKQTLRFLPVTFIAASAVACLAGCGGEKASASTAANSDGAVAAQEQPTLTPDRFINVTANDQMKFNRNEIKAKAGQVLSVTLTNEGTMPKFSMGHNFVVLQQDTDQEQFLEAAMTQAGNDYLPKEFQSSIIAATKLLGGGESDTIVFQLPEKPGKYPFLCSFPGRYQVGMSGVIVVE